MRSVTTDASSAIKMGNSVRQIKPAQLAFGRTLI